MQKSLIMLSLILNSFLNLALAREPERLPYQCNYSVTEEDGDDTEYVVIDINLNNPPKVTYKTTELFETLEFGVEKVDSKSRITEIYGTLPSPWPTNSKFEIKLYKGGQTGILKIVVPGIDWLNPIRMNCI